MRRGGFEPFNGPMRTKNWDNPLKWQRQAERSGKRLRVFTCSMSDYFHPAADDWRDEAWSLIQKCDMLDWLILTKRPELVRERLPHDWYGGYANVWLGVTAGCRESLQRIDILSDIPTAIRFVSAEPLLERLVLTRYLAEIDWVITGCERAKKGKRRLMDVDWVRDIDEQCLAAGVPHFFKQYYEDDTGLPREDGLLDGIRRQAWPPVPVEA